MDALLKLPVKKLGNIYKGINTLCGLVGIVGQYPNKEKNFRTLLMLDSTRGEHSTGVAIRVALEDNRAKTRIVTGKQIGRAHV